MTAIKSQGVCIDRGDGGSPETFTTIGEVVTFQGPGGEAAEIDVTNLKSSAKEFIMGLPDEGDVSLSLNLDPQDAQQTALRADRAAQTLRNFRITLTDSGATTVSFAAYVKGFSISGGIDDKVTADVALRVSGALTWA